LSEFVSHHYIHIHLEQKHLI